MPPVQLVACDAMVHRLLSLRLLALLAAALCTLAVAGCGESEAEKAKAQVCKAKTEINKQVEALKNLPLNASALETANKSFQTIIAELGKMKEAAPKLESSLKNPVEQAQATFKNEVGKLTVEAIKGGVASGNTATALKASIEKLLRSYKQSIETIPCS
ncbi:MAG TPA: hypothetical protein VMG62_01820 [Solirubrobacteraceae bacterium]|nr:hypothetical protein [Solirubrobacteraceae bacterium]